MCVFLFALGLGFLTLYERDSYRLMCVFLLGLPTFFVSPVGTKRSFARRCVWPGIVWALLTVQPAQMLLRNGLSLSLEALVDYLVQVGVLCSLGACLWWLLGPKSLASTIAKKLAKPVEIKTGPFGLLAKKLGVKLYRHSDGGLIIETPDGARTKFANQMDALAAMKRGVTRMRIDAEQQQIIERGVTRMPVTAEQEQMVVKRRTFRLPNKAGIARFLLQFVVTIILLAMAFASKPSDKDLIHLGKLIVCGASAYLAYVAVVADRSGWGWILGSLAVAFNPFIPVYMHREEWQVLDFAAAVTIAVSVFALRRAVHQTLEGGSSPAPSLQVKK